MKMKFNLQFHIVFYFFVLFILHSRAEVKVTFKVEKLYSLFWYGLNSFYLLKQQTQSKQAYSCVSSTLFFFVNLYL